MRRERQIPMQFRACTPRDVGVDFTDDAPAALRYAIASYFAAFEAPRRTRLGSLLCTCGAQMTGFAGSFTWGLAHGEGFCSECGRPARAYHRVPDENRSDALSLTFVLLHPLDAREAAA